MHAALSAVRRTPRMLPANQSTACCGSQGSNCPREPLKGLWRVDLTVEERHEHFLVGQFAHRHFEHRSNIARGQSAITRDHRSAHRGITEALDRQGFWFETERVCRRPRALRRCERTLRPDDRFGPRLASVRGFDHACDLRALAGRRRCWCGDFAFLLRPVRVGLSWRGREPNTRTNGGRRCLLVRPERPYFSMFLATCCSGSS